MEEEDGKINEDHNEEWKDEDDSQWGEDPHQVVQVVEIILHVLQTGPLLPQVNHAGEIVHRFLSPEAGVILMWHSVTVVWVV